MIKIKDIHGASLLTLNSFRPIEGTPLIEYIITVNYDCFYAKLIHNTDFGDFELLEDRLNKLYHYEIKEVLFDTIDSKLTIRFMLTNTYDIKVKISVVNNDYSGNLEFVFLTDQTLIKEMINNISILIDYYRETYT